MTPISRLLLEMMKARGCPLFGGSYLPLHTSQLTPLMVVMANKLVEPTAGDENFIFRILIKESEQMLAAWPSGQGAGLQIWRSRIEIPLRPLAGFVPGSPWLNSSAALVYSQLVCLLPVGILNLLSFFQSGVPVN